MLAQQQLFPAYSSPPPYGYRAHKTTVFQTPFVDREWYDTWPTIGSILLGGLMLISSAAVIGLEIGNLAIEGNKRSRPEALGRGPAKVGAGLWSGSVSFLAALFIISIVFVRNRRVAATFALIAVGLAFLFTIVLIGLTANAIQVSPDLYKIQYRLVVAILSIALFILTQCIAFVILYVGVFFSSATRGSSVYVY